MVDKSQLLMTLPAEASSIAVVRAAFGARAAQLGMSEAGVGDLKTAVSEACSNVVLHAYGDGELERPLEIELSGAGGTLDLTVRDRGAGIQPVGELGASSAKLGLTLIGAVCS